MRPERSRCFVRWNEDSWSTLTIGISFLRNSEWQTLSTVQERTHLQSPCHDWISDASDRPDLARSRLNETQNELRVTLRRSNEPGHAPGFLFLHLYDSRRRLSAIKL